MPSALSVSLTTGDTRAYVYPENAVYVPAPQQDDILYSVVLTPKPRDDGRSR